MYNEKIDFTRRRFVATVTTASIAAAFSNSIAALGRTGFKDQEKLAILGGTPIHTRGWLDWPAILADKKLIASSLKPLKVEIGAEFSHPQEPLLLLKGIC